MSKDGVKPSNWIESVNCAIEGILWAAKTQRHMRYHFLAALVVLLLALLFKVSALELILLSLAITLVLFAELVNTALEVLVDLVSPEFHPLAGRVKDVAAGAVLVASIGAAFIGYLGLSRFCLPIVGSELNRFGHPAGSIALVSVLIVTILVVLLKALFGRGTPLHGGMPSGHAAVACSIATSIIFSKAAPLVALMAVALAVMVSHSRLLMKIHTLREVLTGALLGVGVTVILHWTFV